MAYIFSVKKSVLLLGRRLGPCALEEVGLEAAAARAEGTAKEPYLSTISIYCCTAHLVRQRAKIFEFVSRVLFATDPESALRTL